MNRYDLGSTRAWAALQRAREVLAPVEAAQQRNKAARDRAAEAALEAAARALALARSGRALGARSRGGRYGRYTAPGYPPNKSMTALRTTALLPTSNSERRR